MDKGEHEAGGDYVIDRKKVDAIMNRMHVRSLISQDEIDKIDEILNEAEREEKKETPLTDWFTRENGYDYG